VKRVWKEGAEGSLLIRRFWATGRAEAGRVVEPGECRTLVLETTLLPVQGDVVLGLFHPERPVLDGIAIDGLFVVLFLELGDGHGLLGMRSDSECMSSLRPYSKKRREQPNEHFAPLANLTCTLRLTEIEAGAVVDQSVMPDGDIVDLPLDPSGVFRSLSELRVEEGEGVVALCLGDAEDSTGETGVDKDALDTGHGLQGEEWNKVSRMSRTETWPCRATHVDSNDRMSSLKGRPPDMLSCRLSSLALLLA
jgi:hypothetical protein